MYWDFLNKVITNNPATFVKAGYGQVEPNLLAAQATKQIYAQAPADEAIDILQNGQFVKYDLAAGEDGIGRVNFDGKGEWMLVYNEIKLYREDQADCEFAMIKDNYQARLWSPYDGQALEDRQTRFYNGKDAAGNTSITVGDKTYSYDDVTAGEDYREINYNEDPFHIVAPYKPAKMPAGTQMVPRVSRHSLEISLQQILSLFQRMERVIQMFLDLLLVLHLLQEQQMVFLRSQQQQRVCFGR